ncbi:hypothetical protein [Catenuloplanes indicus]|uniref:Uncharacterized protein n=1 Tax=Catenuloplanes indicus TaxID=137267 RepID=A0AAE4AXF8_9ACTN|nr:hypothetical protein [Catenuloplanes indicus]MDQ0364023.1 hypothetical protein [Catenuloplanes indicus]
MLLDYTTLASAANALSCAELRYPTSVKNPYENFLRGRKSGGECPIWIEFASLAEVIESAILHERIGILSVDQEGGNLRRSPSYPWLPTKLGVFDNWLDEVIVRVEDRRSIAEIFRDGMKFFMEDEDRRNQMAKATLGVLEAPVYRNIPDLFSHSQTIYQLEGEDSLGGYKREFEAAIDREWVRLGRKKIQTAYTNFDYLASIGAFLARALVYNAISIDHGMIFRPHPARAVMLSIDPAMSLRKNADFGSIPANFARGFRDEVAKFCSQDYGGSDWDIDLFPVFAFVVNTAKSPDDILKVCREVRDSRGAINLRAWMTEMFGEDSGLKEAEGKRQLEALKESLRRELGIGSEKFEVNAHIITFKVKIPPIFQRFKNSAELSSRKRFLRNLALTAADTKSLENRLFKVFGISQH